MKIEQHYTGLYHATGNGPLRPILTEGGTRQEAKLHYCDAYRDQQAELQKRYPQLVITKSLGER